MKRQGELQGPREKVLHITRGMEDRVSPLAQHCTAAATNAAASSCQQLLPIKELVTVHRRQRLQHVVPHQRVEEAVLHLLQLDVD